jgi:hypothetical protein
MRSSVGVALACAALGGCFPPEPVYRVQRSARVPRPTVPLRTGQPLSGPVEITFGASSLGEIKTPEAGNSMKALEVPRYQLRAELRARLFERGELALIHERAVGGSTKIDPTQADVDSGQPWAAGAAWRYSIAPHGEPWSIGVDFELLRWEIPYVEYRWCVENCENVDVYQETHSSNGELTWGFGITPAYRIGRVSLFGGMFLRNHPTIARKGEEIGEMDYSQEEVEGGPVNILLNAGVAVKFGAFTALALVHQDIDKDPVRYGPSLGLALSASIDPIRPQPQRVNHRPPGMSPSTDPPPTEEEQY